MPDASLSSGRDDTNRTCDLLDPNQALHHAELHPENLYPPFERDFFGSARWDRTTDLSVISRTLVPLSYRTKIFISSIPPTVKS